MFHGRPIFFFQDRPGLHAKIFRIQVPYDDQRVRP
jgi:hypothetical protein